MKKVVNQTELFENESKNNNEYLHNQLIKLGDMMGDGLHHEADGKWISREYRKISKILFPDIFKKKRKQKSEAVQKRMDELLPNKKCECGGNLVQKRKGTKVCYCVQCDTRFVLRNKSKK